MQRIRLLERLPLYMFFLFFGKLQGLPTGCTAYTYLTNERRVLATPPLRRNSTRDLLSGLQGSGAVRAQ